MPHKETDTLPVQGILFSIFDGSFWECSFETTMMITID